MNTIDKIRAEIERLMDEYNPIVGGVDELTGSHIVLAKLLSFLSTIESEEPEEKSDLQDAEVVFSGHALHTDVTKWADGYKLKIRIYDDD